MYHRKTNILDDPELAGLFNIHLNYKEPLQVGARRVEYFGKCNKLPRHVVLRDNAGAFYLVGLKPRCWYKLHIEDNSVPVGLKLTDTDWQETAYTYDRQGNPYGRQFYDLDTLIAYVDKNKQWLNYYVPYKKSKGV